MVIQYIHTTPVTTANLNPSPNAQDKYPEPVTVTLSASAYTGFTIDSTYYALDGEPEQLYTGPLTVSGGGVHTIEYYSIDNAGVYETPKLLTFEITTLRIITEGPLPTGTLGVPYSTLIEAEGGTEPYTWSIAAGALPPGLSINASTGEISGTPTAVGTFGFTVQVTDSSQIVTTKQFTLAPPPSEGTAGSDYTAPISVPDTDPDDTGGTPECTNYELVSGTLPDGLTLDPTTGVISGTPTDGGTYTFTVQCVVSTGQTATKDFTITIINPGPTLTSLSPASAVAGDPAFTLTLTGTNFVQSSVAQWNGAARPTTYVSSTQLQVDIPATDIAIEGSATVAVLNPDPGGGVSNSLTFVIEPPNAPPVANDQSLTTDEDVAVSITLSATDADVDPLTYVLVTNPTNGTLSGTAPNLTYTPNPNYFGSDSFTFKANDGTIDSNVATVSITVNPVNDAPVANDQSVTTDEDVPVSITLSATDVDGDALSYALVTNPTNGTLSGTAPNLTYTPNANYFGSDSFTFKVNDGTVDSNIATVNITVNAVNDPPVCTNAFPSEDFLWPVQHQLVDISIQGVTDVEGDTITIFIDLILQDEPTNGLGDGDQTPDGYGIGASIVQLRSERDGTSNGRIYRVRFSAYDANGASCSGEVYVGVRHDQGRKGEAVDDGPLFDSTTP